VGQGVLPPPATFDAMILLAAMAVHFVLSLVYAFIFAWIVSRWQMVTARTLGLGLVFSLVIYVVNFYASRPCSGQTGTPRDSQVLAILSCPRSAWTL
jgi:uncharacterized membrane protein YagU involved in acid resistance